MYDYDYSTQVYEIVPYKKPKRRMGFVKATIAAMLVAVCLGTSFGFGLGASGLLAKPEAPVQEAAAASPYKSDITFINTLPSTSNGVVDVVRESSNSVVSINISGLSRTIFNRSQQFESAGSGIIIGEDSTKLYIATNNHVIENASSVTISVDDTKQVSANYVSSDFASDLAVISVTKQAMADAGVTGYKIAATGDSDRLEVGELVVAIGNALGEGKTATMGIVSAKDKEIAIDSRKISVLQTDAAINPGNSGGALVNMKAEVVGINTAKLSEVGVEGMGYSIPINEAKAIIDRMISDGAPASKAYLGIQGVDIDEQTRAANDLPSTGVYVYSVLSGSGAEAAGLRRGDLIFAYNDKKISAMADLQQELTLSKVGDTVRLKVYRNGAEGTVEVVLKDANQKF